MTKLLRNPRLSSVKDGDSFVDVRDDEVIAQVAKVSGKKVDVIEVRKELDGAQGEERQKIIQAAKAEAKKKHGGSKEKKESKGGKKNSKKK